MFTFATLVILPLASIVNCADLVALPYVPAVAPESVILIAPLENVTPVPPLR